MSNLITQDRRVPETDFRSRSARSFFAAAMTLLLLFPFRTFAADGIVAVHENGRVIFVNNEAAALPADGTTNTPTVRKRLVYWSNVEHRWKRVPMTSVAARSARYAAREVSAAFDVPTLNNPAASEPSAAQSAATPEMMRTTVQPQVKVTQQNVDAAIEAAAKRHNVDANLVRAMIKVESNFNSRAVSRKGAMGLMQLMPSTARELNVRNPFDPNQNVDGGVRHLKVLLDNYGGDVQMSLAAYNAGAGAVSRSRGVPHYAETQDYVKKITRLYGGPMSGNSHGANANIRTSRDEEGHLVVSNE